jgi:hypothetical protein
MANASDMESLKIELARELLDYLKEYMDEFNLYYGSQIVKVIFHMSLERYLPLIILKK